jgi:hypothetical protein
LRDQSGWKESLMIQFEDAPFVGAELKEHHAALIRQMVAIGIVICVMLVLVGLHH